MRKAVSPLLAGVLLIAVTVGIATLTTGFISTTFRSTESAVSNKTADSVSCANAGIVIDDVYAKVGDNGTITVPVRNSGFADLQLTSAQLYDKLGNNFSASSVPLSINRGQIISLSFKLANLSNVTADSSGMGNNGNCRGMGTGGANSTCAFTLSGKSGSAMSFDGANYWIMANNSILNMNGTDFTVEAFVKPNALDIENPILNKNWYFHATSNQGYSLRFTPDNNLTLSLWNNSNNGSAFSMPSGISVNTWYHVAASFNLTPRTVSLYVNGILIGASSSLYNMTAATNNTFKIGARPAGDKGDNVSVFFNGAIDEVAVWNRTLSGEEINVTMNNGVASTGTAGLVGYWKFDEGRGILTCSDFSQVVVTTNCGGISATFDRAPKCS